MAPGSSSTHARTDRSVTVRTLSSDFRHRYFTVCRFLAGNMSLILRLLKLAKDRPESKLEMVVRVNLRITAKPLTNVELVLGEPGVTNSRIIATLDAA